MQDAGAGVSAGTAGAAAAGDSLAAYDRAAAMLAATRDRLVPPSSYLAKTTRQVTVLWPPPGGDESCGASMAVKAMRCRVADFTDVTTYEARSPGNMLTSVDTLLAAAAATALLAAARPVAFFDLTGLADGIPNTPDLTALLVRVVAVHPLVAALVPTAVGSDVKCFHRLHMEVQAITDDWALVVLVAEMGPSSTGLLNRPAGVPTVGSRGQFAFARADPDLWVRVERAISSRLYGYPGTTVRRLTRVLEDMVVQGGSDAAVYAQLHTAFHSDIVPVRQLYRPPYCFVGRAEAAVAAAAEKEHGPGISAEKESGRAGSRVNEVLQLLPPAPAAIKRMLDFGCAEGSITAAIGQAYGVAMEDVHGCDVREPAARDGFVFTIVDGRRLPYADASFDMVTALMALHHVADVPSMLAEFSRVLAPGGFLVVREHDCARPELAVPLDIVHGLYSLVWTSPQEWPAFLEEYYAHYRPRTEWTALCGHAGLARVTDSALYPQIDMLYDLCCLNDPAAADAGGYDAESYNHSGAKFRDDPRRNDHRRDDWRQPLHANATKNPQRFFYGLYRKPPTPV